MSIVFVEEHENVVPRRQIRMSDLNSVSGFVIIEDAHADLLAISIVGRKCGPVKCENIKEGRVYMGG